MVVQIDSLRVVFVTNVVHHQYVSQIRVILRNFEATTPLQVFNYYVLRSHQYCVL